MTKNLFVRKTKDVRSAGQSETASFFLATVASVSSSEGVTIIPDGQTEEVQKKYKILVTGQTPEVDDRVVVMKHSGTCIILGKIGQPDSGGEKVSKTGDTMTGPLVMEDTSLNIDSSDVTVGTRPASNIWVHAIRLRDSVKTQYARILGFFGSNGQNGLQLYASRTINNSVFHNMLGLYVNEGGEGIVDINQPGAWRTALGLELPITPAQGGTGLTSNPSMLVDLGSVAAAAVLAENPRPGVTGTLPVNHGGTGLSSSPSMLVNLASTTAAGILSANPRPGVTGTLPVGNGGTGQTATSSTGTLSDIITGVSGFSIVSQHYAQWGKVAQLFLQLYNSNAYSVDAYGNLTTAVANIGTLVSGKRPEYTTALVSSHNGSARSYGRILNSGVVQLLGFEGTGATRNIPASTLITLSATYLLA